MVIVAKPYKFHVADVLGNTIGRDQPIMRINKALDLVSLLSEDTFIDDNNIFFDPFCKAGEILLACAYMTCAMKSKNKLMSINKEQITHEIFGINRYFALAPDERHHRLSLRTFLGNKISHDSAHNSIIKNGNYLSEIDGRLNLEKFYQELATMIKYIKKTAGDKRVVAIGNPPYQESDGGYGKSARAIYNFFIEALVDSESIDQFVLVVPARWFSGGKGLDNFRAKMLKLKQLKQIRYFENPHEIFPTVDLGGGICFVYWSMHHKGDTIISNGADATSINLSTYDIIIPHILAYSILNKVRQKANKFLDQVIWPRKPFGLETNYFSKNKNYTSGDIQCFYRGKRINNISRQLILKNNDKIDRYKVALPKAYGGSKGKRDKILPKPNAFFVLDKNQVSTETYSVAGDFATKKEADNYLAFLQTNFARFLWGLRKPSHDTSVKTYAWIPFMDTEIRWTDEMLFEHFKINEREQQYIKQRVDKWTA